MSFEERGEPTPFKAQCSRTACGQVKVVRHQYGGEAMACVQALDQVEDTTGGGLVQIAGGFVGQEQPRVVDQRTGQGDALLLAAGELAGPMVAAIVQAHLPERASSGMATFSSAVNSGSR
jgi:acyl-CoA thioesterase-1